MWVQHSKFIVNLHYVSTISIIDNKIKMFYHNKESDEARVIEFKNNIDAQNTYETLCNRLRAIRIQQ
jgi:hypothetical protein